ncbi:heme ABC transporter ATP-binding protein [Hoeflea prorocentri]|uniref:Heme ABC transporter ATP-binding protein n=1 Tax=Hoeflea prorocentri TaxID=1922333 RepID=A0A9X3UF13_9HYPH|nr:heme ABC transporter ATP-binding protein [Hoeflea prorocentri]MCY6379675.1 heme ABC transporter ATP-binding protein [Hoeflea prorocentri]MDA5397475.1 heme ABC transporter ATP-binding protein [Hoeflea prorocentri]
MIEVNKTTVHIGRKPIVENASFRASAGEITTIIGPNGSGKTTLLRAVSGDLAYSGSVRFYGREIAKHQPWEMALWRAVLPQISHLSFPFTVREVVRFGLTTGRSGVPVQVAERLVEQALERVDLEGFVGRFYQELSGGEQQRVQLARVLCQVWEPVFDNRSRFLFLDEPISSLDIRHQLIIMDIARDYVRKGGGVLAVLHDLNLTSMYSDKVLAMKGGRCVEFGAPSKVIKTDLLRSVFDCDLQVDQAPRDTTFVLPQSAMANGVASAGQSAARS